MRRKHIPQRTCIGCRKVRAKRDLIRIVRTPGNEIVVDLQGKQNGRGAYMCPDSSCLESALQGSKLSKALNTEIDQADKQRLKEWLADYEGGKSTSS